MAIALFFTAHWFSSLFCQTSFCIVCGTSDVHDDEILGKVFYIATFITQGSSYLSARAYAIMHRMHHAYSDTERDPHSPHFFRSVLAMMWRTKAIYYDLVTKRMRPGDNFEQNCPDWKRFDNFADRFPLRLAWGGLYVLFYFFLRPPGRCTCCCQIHFLMVPVHGSILNDKLNLLKIWSIKFSE